MVSEMNITNHYVDLLERVIEENKQLREAVQNEEKANRKIFEDLSSRLNERAGEESERTTTSRRRRTKIAVPQLCRVSITLIKVYKGNG